jgi:hypothetical protein
MVGLFTKYVYISIMFIVAFVAMFNYITAPIGFGLVFGVQTIYTLVTLFEVAKDTARHLKSISITFPKTPLSDVNEVSIPLYWVLCPGVIMQFVASLLTVISSDFLKKKYNAIQLARNARWNLDIYKWMYVGATVSLLGLTYSYTSDFENAITTAKFSGTYKTLLLVYFVFSIILPVLNVLNANQLSKIVVSTTDG